MHIHLILLLLSFQNHLRVEGSETETQRDALLSFKSQVSDPKNSLSGWTASANSSYCTWFGVSCSRSKGRVESLSLPGLSLFGKLPYQLTHLIFLNSLDLSNNKFEGQVPLHFSLLSCLELINLATNNQFHGFIPLFTNMINLTSLILGNNYLSSTTTLNYQLFDSFRNSTQLKMLMTYSNQMAGQLPISVANISRHLQHFCVADTLLTDSIPQGMRNFRNLESLSLEMNEFTGEMPLEIGDLRQLVQLSIYNNRLSEEIPDMFGNFTQLSFLRMGYNQFPGTIPASIGQCKQLNFLHLGINKLQGETPNENLSLSCRGFLKISYLDIRVATNNFAAENPVAKGGSGNVYKGMWLHPEDEESGSSLTLLERLNIAVDVASAMDYLHHDCDPRLVHCDLKPSKVLSDKTMGAWGFWIEYGLSDKTSTSEDVYSFGILLLEMFTTKMPTDKMFKKGLNLNKFASCMNENNQVLHIANPGLLKDCEYSSEST
ncbi:hypothetical protein L6164_030270 [Bauhinia variegata]|uniref:Uncharacterized protein n=1 Tax=Bauhinia variegata TaxID=167791 RepID=A0ACB9LC64_BAUVA|nr:hypothetical protein L6164_030270 [Bauhinia variegata]